MKTKKYRYRDYAGTTQASIKAMKHLTKIGRVKYIRGYTYRGRYNTEHNAVLVVGELGSVRFNGFAWGYGGTGPNGLKQLLTKLEVDTTEIERVLDSKWNGWDEIKEHWRINRT